MARRGVESIRFLTRTIILPQRLRPLFWSKPAGRSPCRAEARSRQYRRYHEIKRNESRAVQSSFPAQSAAKKNPDFDVTVYAVDDDETTLDVLGLLLKSVGLEATAYTSPGEFLEKVDPYRPGCVVLDLWMPELNGFETLMRLRERAKTIPVVFLTGHGDLPAVVRAMRLGVGRLLREAGQQRAAARKHSALGPVRHQDS